MKRIQNGAQPRVRKKSILWRTATPFLWPLMPLYTVGARLKNAAFDRGLAKPRCLSQPVVSVGNLSVGGTGKTPVVLLLAELLQSRGWAVDVLSRGYGRTSKSVERVDPSGASDRFGDEPLLMARRGLAVYVGADRYQAGQLAEREQSARTSRTGKSLHLLDDGFQHRKLARAVDIVLVERSDLEDALLPAGRLRETLAALQRADICVLQAQDADLTERVLSLMKQNDPARIWIVDRRTVLPTGYASLSSVLAFCAIGDPEGFFSGLQKAGTTLADTIAYRDHHIYTRADMERLKQRARSCGASHFVTTEKDNVRLTDASRSDLESELPLVVAGLAVTLQEEARAMALLESFLAQQLQTGLPQQLQTSRRGVR